MRRAREQEGDFAASMFQVRSDCLGLLLFAKEGMAGTLGATRFYACARQWESAAPSYSHREGERHGAGKSPTASSLGEGDASSAVSVQERTGRRGREVRRDFPSASPPPFPPSPACELAAAAAARASCRRLLSLAHGQPGSWGARVLPGGRG